MVVSDAGLLNKLKARFRIEPLTKELIARLWRDYMSAHRGLITIAVLFMIIVAMAGSGMVKLVEPALDRAFVQKNETWIWLAATGFLVVSIVRGGANFAQTVLMQTVGLRVIEKMQSQMLHSLLHIEMAYLEREGTARQLSRFTADCYFLRDAVTKVFTGVGRDIMTLMAMIAMMIHLNAELAGLALIFFPMSILPIARIGRRLRKVSGRTQSELGQLTSVLDDSFKNARQVRAYGMQDHEAQRGAVVFRETYHLLLKTVRTRALSHPIMDTLAGMTLFTIIAAGGYQILEGTQTIGSFMAFFIAVLMAYQPMRSLASLNSSLQEGLAAARRIFAIIDHVPEIRSLPNAKPLPAGNGTVLFQDVDFAYDDNVPVLESVNIEIKAGETVALVGPSGAGKSTLLNLIPRFYDVTGGNILMDGCDIREARLDSVLARIALVSQEPALFNETIRDNISYGRREAGQEEIEEAARNAAAHEFIMELPNGYDTIVGEQGLRLSGGQRQRIAIARAMLKDAPILLLDEATSALDADSESIVQEALGRLMVDRTTVVIAHRLATVRKADRIFVMDNGRVIETGTHASLSQQDGLYAKLCHMQFHPERTNSVSA